MSTDPADGTTDAPVLLYDGLCAMCNGAVRFVLAHDRAATMRFAPLQGEYAASVRAANPAVAHIDSILLVPPRAGPHAGQVVLARSDAAIAVAEYLGGAWRAAAVARVIPRRIRDGVYDLIARNRQRISRTYDACPVPPAAHRARFLP